jgi:hypothetical protein
MALGKIGRLFHRTIGAIPAAPVFLGYQALAIDPKYFQFIFIKSLMSQAFVSLMDFRVYLLF